MLSKLRNWILLFIAMFMLLSSVGLSTKAVLAAPEDEDQNPSIIIKAKGTYGNYTKQGVWLPLQVEVTNQGADLQGDLRVTPNENNLEFNTMDYVSSAVIPQGSTKGFNFYIPVQGLTSVNIELVSGDQVLAKQTVKFAFLSNNELIIGLLDRSEEGLAPLNGLKQASWLGPVVTTIKNEDLPEKADLLGFFNVLLFNDVNLKLSKEQSTALTHWVSRGGTLVVGGGSGWQKVLPNLPQELQAVTVSGVETLTLSALPSSLSKPISEAISGPVRIAKLQSSKGKPLFSEQGRPLAIKYPFGEGEVLYLAFDPALEPMSNWTGSEVLWKDLVFAEKPEFGNGLVPGQLGGPFFKGQFNNAYGMANALGNIEDMALPSLRTMAWMIGPYLLLAGLLNYLVLKKLDRREWTWLTVPALSVIFVLLIYFTSFKTRPAEIIAHQINVVEMMPGTSLAKVTAVTGLFAPTHATYHLELPGKHLVSALPNLDGGMRIDPRTNQRPNATLRVEQTPGQTNIDFLQMRSWVMRGFSAVEDASLTGSISGEISFKDNKWLATITNGTQYNFTDGVIVSSPNWFTKIAALNAGEKTETEINLNTNNNLNNGAPIAYQIYNPQVNWQGSGPPPRPQARDMMRQQIFESQLGNGWDPGSESKLLFFGWSAEPLQGGLSIEDNKVKKYYTTLFQVPLHLKFDPERLEVPEGFISGTLLSSQNVGFGPGSIMMQANSEAVYQMQLPEGKFSEMQLNIHKRNGASFSAAVKGYLYNWKTAAWDDINMTSDNTVIKDPTNYFNSGRLVRFKISNQPELQSQSQSQSQFNQPQQFQDQEFFGVNISLSSKGGAL
ncbi:hypothetical protein [Desulfosporosinus sp. BICA1-9]|uniref:hypothetical protein n=1 Tax=Desulfosporosinus sp. BICA1-9 TaxID=1531958 RepID=UPI000B1E4D32|nr:hypothetical protein [Desulfosporosinus sp. BICA1-9]